MSKTINGKFQKWIAAMFVWCFWIAIGSTQQLSLMDVPFYDKDNNRLVNGYAGGLSAPQFANIDLNRDGVKDVVVFDRLGNVLLPFIQEGGNGQVNLKYDPTYRQYFPKDLSKFLLVADYNNDGIEDLFTLPVADGVAGIAVYKGSIVDGHLSFKQMKFEGRNYLVVNAGSAFTNFYNSIIDIPAIVDVDFDGDLDFLSFESDGLTLTLGRNMAKEKGLSLDSITTLKDEICFGRFKEDGLSSGIIVSSSPDACASGLHDDDSGSTRHSGSTVTMFDLHCDQKMDIIVGDLSSPTLKFLINTGTVAKPWITSVVDNYPDGILNIPYFLAAYQIDANNDGVKDLVITTNQEELLTSNHIYLYLNTGTDCEPIYTLSTKIFLLETMVSAGYFSHPALADIDADGKIDLLLAGDQAEPNTTENRLFYFRNIGTPSMPAFRLMDDNYLNIRDLDWFSSSLAPSFGDIDSDGDKDLVIGTSTSSNFLFYQNTAGPNQPMSFSPMVANYFNFDFGSYKTPIVYDFDKDGLNDIISGELNINLNFLKNIGTIGNPNFNKNVTMLPNVDNLGKVFNSTDFNYRNSDQVFFTSDSSKYCLQSGTRGAIRLFQVLSKSPEVPFLKVQENTTDLGSGWRITMDIADIDNDNFYDLVIGNGRGGVEFFRTNFIVIGPNANQDFNALESFAVNPNPFNQNLIVSCGDDVNVIISAVNGSFKYTQHFTQGEHHIDTSTWPSGLYILQAKGVKGSKILKLIKY